MAEAFFVTCASSIGTGNVILLGPVPAATTFIVTGAIFSNIYQTSVSTATVSCYVSNAAGGSPRVWLVRGGNVPFQTALPLLGTNHRLVLEASDSLNAKSQAGVNSLDAIVTYMQVT